MREIKRKFNWLGILALVISIMLSACAKVPEDKPKEPDTIDITASVFTRRVIDQGEKYFGSSGVALSNPQIDAFGELMKLESWIPIFKPVYPFKIGFALIDANGNKFSFGLYDNKLLVVAEISPRFYYFEGPKTIYTDVKTQLDAINQSSLALPEYRDSVMVTALVQNTLIYEGWFNVKITGQIETSDLEKVLKRSAWLSKDNATHRPNQYVLILTDSTGLSYRFISAQGDPAQVEIYSEPFALGEPLAIYMIPDQVIENTVALLKPLIVTTPAGDSVTKAVFVKAYLGLHMYFAEETMLSDYGYTFTSAQRTTFNAIDRSWLKLSFPTDLNGGIFALTDSIGNTYFFDTIMHGALIKVVPKDKTKQIECYLAPDLDAFQLYLDLLAAYPPKAVLPIVKTVSFASVFEKADETSEYLKISNLTSTQSKQLIAILDYSNWTQTVGMPAAGWWFQFKAVTTSGLDYPFGFNFCVCTFPNWNFPGF